MDSSTYGRSVPQGTDSALVRKAFAELLSMRALVQSMHEEIQSLLKESQELREKAQAAIDESQALRARRDTLLKTAAYCGDEVSQSVGGAGGSVVCPDCGKLNTAVGATQCVACGRTLAHEPELLL